MKNLVLGLILLMSYSSHAKSVLELSKGAPFKVSQEMIVPAYSKTIGSLVADGCMIMLNSVSETDRVIPVGEELLKTNSFSIKRDSKFNYYGVEFDHDIINSIICSDVRMRVAGSPYTREVTVEFMKQNINNYFEVLENR